MISPVPGAPEELELDELDELDELELDEFELEELDALEDPDELEEPPQAASIPAINTAAITEVWLGITNPSILKFFMTKDCNRATPQQNVRAFALRPYLVLFVPIGAETQG